MLSKEQIKAVQDRGSEWLSVPDWTPAGETHDPATHGVYVRSMSARERDAWELYVLNARKGDTTKTLANMRAKLAIVTVCDPSGAALFTDADADWLGEKSSSALALIFDAACRINKLRQQDQDELLKN